MKNNLISSIFLMGIMCPVLAFSGPNTAPVNPKNSVQQMLSFFGGQCSVSGHWTEQMNDSVNKIIEIVRSADQDPNCSSVSGLVNQLNIIRSRLFYLNQSENQIENEINSYQSRIRETVFLLAQGPAMPNQNLLEEDLVISKLALASAQGELIGTRRIEKLERKENSYYQIVSSTNSIMNAIASQEACWSNHPGLLENVAGLGMAVSQSLSLAPALSTGSILLGAGVGLASNVIEALHRAAQEREMKNF